MNSAKNFLSKREVVRRTSLSYSTIWRQIREGRFPAGIKITSNRIAWLESDVDSWMKSKVNDNA